MIVSAASLSGGTSGSVVGSWRESVLRPGLRSYFGRISITLVREGHGVRVVDTDTQSADELSRVIKERPEDVAFASLDGLWHPHGFWAATTAARTHAIEIGGGSGDPGLASWSQADRAAAREAVVREAARFSSESEWQRYVSLLRAGDGRETRIVWTGVAWNAATLAALVVFLLAAPSVLEMFDRKGARLRRGRCGACGYDLSGCGRDAGGVVKCPECGREWVLGVEA